ncbi:MAG: flagellar motor protein MotD [Rhodanobacter sp.]
MRRKHHEDHVNHEAWAIPYADLMTLLLAFFVVMYAVSVVNEGKYRVMSQSIIEAFNGTSRSLSPVHSSDVTPPAPVPADKKSTQTQTTIVPRVVLPLPTRSVLASDASKVGPASKTTADSKTTEKEELAQNRLDQIRDQVQHALQPLIDKKLVVVRRTPSWLEIEIRTDILFPSGVARLSAPADDVLNHLADILSPFPNPLRVEGYTDDVPINTAVYPSNWELSAARAASVARLFSEHGVDPNRLGIIGWGEYRPEAANDSTDGRNRNRRVLVVVLSDHNAPSRFYSDADRVGQLAENSSDGKSPVESNLAAPSPTTASPTTTLPAAPVPVIPATVLLPMSTGQAPTDAQQSPVTGHATVVGTIESGVIENKSAPVTSALAVAPDGRG